MSVHDPTGPGSPSGDERFRPGGTSEAQARAYGDSVGVAPAVALAGPGATEDAASRAARLRRRRRLLTWGGAPAVLVLLASVWMGAVSVLTLLGNRAAVHADYQAAVARYRAVEVINPLLEQWRVHYNLGTAHLLAGSTDDAVRELEQALTTAPRAGTVTATGTEGKEVSALDPTAPECLVRLNLSAAHTGAAAEAEEAGDTAGAAAQREAATKAAGDCPVPPQDPTSDPTPTSGPTSTATPTSDPTPSATPTAPQSATPQPSGSSSPTPSPDPTAEPTRSASAEPTASPSVSPGPTSTPSPVDEKQRELEERNKGTEGSGSSVGGVKGW